MNRIEIINLLIAKNNYKSYLEIGVRDGSCFNVINCDNKVGVDPDLSSAATVYLTSDDYFKQSDEKFDIIFIDGLHHSDFVTKDIANSLKHLNEGGTIVMHDCLPTSKRMQEIPLQEQNEWCGDVWKSWVALRQTRDDLTMHCINTDWGTSIIRLGHQNKIVIKEAINYENFVKNKQKWMNVISVAEFKRLYLI